MANRRSNCDRSYILEILICGDYIAKLNDLRVVSKSIKCIVDDTRTTVTLDCSKKPERTNIKFKNVRQLKVINCNDVTTFLNVINQSKLTKLDLSWTEVSDVSALGQCTNLVKLDLSNTEVSDVSALGQCTNLVKLSLWGTQVTDVTALAKCTKVFRRL